MLRGTRGVAPVTFVYPSQLDPNVDMASPLALAIYMFVGLILMHWQQGSDIESKGDHVDVGVSRKGLMQCMPYELIWFPEFRE